MTDQLETQITHLARHLPYPAYPLRTERPALQWRLASLSLAVIVIVVIPVLLIQIGAVTLEIGRKPDLPDKLVELVGETTWQEAQQTVGFTLMKPASLPDPDSVYLQNADTVIFVWLEDTIGEDIALYQMNGEQYTIFKQVEDATMTTVNDSMAIWIDEPHTIQFLRDGHTTDEATYLVEGHVLIWLTNSITYRLETGRDLETAITLAESLVEMGTVSD